MLASTHAISQESRIGSFDKQSIVLGYYRSGMWAETLMAKRTELAEAKQNNDQAKIKELNGWGAASQDLAMKQLMGDAPIDNILVALKPAFEEIEKTDNLSKVVPASSDLKGPSVDVTGRLLDWLKADETTRKMILDLKKK